MHGTYNVKSFLKLQYVLKTLYAPTCNVECHILTGSADPQFNPDVGRICP
jgi:hypothetical protein